MSKLILALFVPLTLIGCDKGNSSDSPIEKCTQAGMEVGAPYKNKDERAEQEWKVRLKCMKAAAGQD